MKTNAGNLKKGDFVFHQGDIWQVAKAEFYSPGKGSALMKSRIKNIVSGKNIEYTYKSNESVDVVDVESIEMQYLYKDHENAHFMNERNYNQYHVPLAVAGDIVNFLKEGEKCFVYLHEDKPLTIRGPMSVRLKIVESQESVKGDTATGGARKAAKLETGVTVMVPLFVKTGETIVVNPETGEYVERVKG